MEQEEKDREMEELLLSACETKNPNDPQVFNEVSVRLALITAIAYGRQSPEKEKLIRLIKFYERVKWEKFSPDPRHVFSLDHIVDQFLQSEASKEK